MTSPLPNTTDQQAKSELSSKKSKRVDHSASLKRTKNRLRATTLIAVLAIITAATFGFLWSQNQPPSSTDITDENSIVQNEGFLAADSVQLEQEDAVIASYQKTIDSFKTVVDTLNTRLRKAKAKNNEEAVVTSGATDYVMQLIQNASQFTNSDCNKSLAFLYAAKKIAMSDEAYSSQQPTINGMIKSCEDKILGKAPTASPTSNSFTTKGNN